MLPVTTIVLIIDGVNTVTETGPSVYCCPLPHIISVNTCYREMSGSPYRVNVLFKMALDPVDGLPGWLVGGWPR